jgi:lysyl-tRNA synthetase class 2
MNEMEELINFILGEENFNYLTYKQSFQKFLNLDIDEIKLDHLKKIISETSDLTIDSKDEGLDYLFTHFIELKLKDRGRVFIYNYPISQAALAKKNDDGTAARFELYINGLEMANGFNELNDTIEQEYRFVQDNLARLNTGKKVLPHSNNLVLALNELPNCAGVALGIDRLCMIALNKTSISEVITFTIENA